MPSFVCEYIQSNRGGKIRHPNTECNMVELLNSHHNNIPLENDEFLAYFLKSDQGTQFYVPITKDSQFSKSFHRSGSSKCRIPTFKMGISDNTINDSFYDVSLKKCKIEHNISPNGARGAEPLFTESDVEFISAEFKFYSDTSVDYGKRLLVSMRDTDHTIVGIGRSHSYELKYLSLESTVRYFHHADLYLILNRVVYSENGMYAQFVFSNSDAFAFILTDYQ